MTGDTETNSVTPLGGEEITAEMNTDFTVTTTTEGDPEQTTATIKIL